MYVCEDFAQILDVALRVAEGDISKSNLCNIVMIIFVSALSAQRRELKCASAKRRAI